MGGTCNNNLFQGTYKKMKWANVPPPKISFSLTKHKFYIRNDFKKKIDILKVIDIR